MVSKIIVCSKTKPIITPWRQRLHSFNTGRRVTQVLKGKKRRQAGADQRAPSPCASEVMGPVGQLRFYRPYRHLPILDPYLSTLGIRPSQYCGTLSFVPPLAVKRKTCQLPSPVYHRSVWKSSTAGGHLACPKVKATKTCFRPPGTHHWQACGPVQRFQPTD